MNVTTKRLLAAAGAAIVCTATSAEAQFPISTQIATDLRDARLVPKGLLRLGFDVDFTTYTKLYSLDVPGTLDGTALPLGSPLTRDTTASNLFPALIPSETAVRSIVSDQTYRMNAGAFQSAMQADIRRVPLSLTLGITDRLTFSAMLPLVRSWSRVVFDVDSTDTNVGWNQAIEEIAGAAAAAEAAALLAELERAIMEVEAAIAGGSYGCPSSAQCAAANATVAEANQLLMDLGTLTGLQSSVAQVPSFAPLATSAAGIAITAQIGSVSAALAALGATPILATLPLPVAPTGKGAVDQLLGSPTLGYNAAPIDSVRTASIGDMELGLRYGIFQSPMLRTVVYTTVRLPTGKVDLANNYVDYGTGDHQLDVMLGLETSFEPGTFLGIAANASYTAQLARSLERRVAAPDSLLVPEFSQITVQRDLGDVFQASVYPMIRLTPVFRVYGSVSYYYKQRDGVSAVPGQPELDLDKLERKTQWQALSFGGGISYRTGYVPGVRKPIEAGLSYASTFWGSGGLTPKANRFTLYLRLFAGIFGGAPPEPEDEQ